MSDRFSHTQPSLSGPASAAFAVTPSDSDSLREVSRALYVGEAGSVSARMLSGEVVTFQNLAAGSMLPVRASAVLATGTSAASIVALV